MKDYHLKKAAVKNPEYADRTGYWRGFGKIVKNQNFLNSFHGLMRKRIRKYSHPTAKPDK